MRWTAALSVVLAGCTALADPDAICCGRDGGGEIDAGDFDAGQVDAGDLDAGGPDGDAGPPVDAGGPVDGGPDGGSSVPPIATLVAAGAAHTCAALMDGRVVCWGENAQGQSTGSPSGDVGPTVARTLTGPAIAICAGASFTCAAEAGAVHCWGRNAEGQLGNGFETGPVRGLSAENVAELVCGANHACARTDSGVVFCWGANTRGQVGNGTMGNAPVARQVYMGADRLVAGGLHTCAFATDALYCWGDNANGQSCSSCGDPIFAPELASSGIVAAQMAAGLDFTCLAEVGTIACLPRTHALNSRLPEFLLPLREMTGAGGGLCVRDATDAVRCVGSMADPTFTDGAMPRRLSAGRLHACGIVTSGAVYCWGNNDSGQVAPGPAGETPPTVVPLDGI